MELIERLKQCNPDSELFIEDLTCDHEKDGDMPTMLTNVEANKTGITLQGWQP